MAPYQQGLLNLGFNICSRFLEFPDQYAWLTNRVVFGAAALAILDSGTRRWTIHPNAIQTNGLPFPYGRQVGPP